MTKKNVVYPSVDSVSIIDWVNQNYLYWRHPKLPVAKLFHG